MLFFSTWQVFIYVATLASYKILFAYILTITCFFILLPFKLDFLFLGSAFELFSNSFVNIGLASYKFVI